MRGNILKRVLNRILHFVARHGPGAEGLRPFLHRLRGVSVGKGVFIGEEVYLENEYPEAVEIQDGVKISLRAIIIAHTQGCGRVVLEKDAYIGPNTVIATSGGRELRIGEGAVLGAGVVITKSVPARIFVANEASRPIARVGLPLSKSQRVEDFVRHLAPLKRGRAPARPKDPGTQ